MFNLDGLEAGVAYQIQIRGVTGSGLSRSTWSSPSAPMSTETPEAALAAEAASRDWVALSGGGESGKIPLLLLLFVVFYHVNLLCLDFP